MKWCPHSQSGTHCCNTGCNRPAVAFLVDRVLSVHGRCVSCAHNRRLYEPAELSEIPDLAVERDEALMKVEEAISDEA